MNFDKYSCTYCGQPATELDHVIPVSYGGKERSRANDVVVPCCSTCNIWLSNKPVFTIADRAWRVATMFKRKHKRELAIPDWTVEELLEVSDTMRAYVLESIDARDKLNKVLRRLLTIAGMKYTALEIWAEIEGKEKRKAGR